MYRGYEPCIRAVTPGLRKREGFTAAAQAAEGRSAGEDVHVLMQAMRLRWAAKPHPKRHRTHHPREQRRWGDYGAVGDPRPDGEPGAEKLFDSATHPAPRARSGRIPRTRGAADWYA